jgi:hypothetical protein
MVCVCLAWRQLSRAVILGEQQMTHTYKFILGVFASVVIASTTYAFASENTLLPGEKGEGSGSLSGYSVTNIAFNLNADPTRIESVTFTLSEPAATVKIKLNDSASSWYACSSVTGNDWICQTAGAAIHSTDLMQVIASSH